VLIAGDLIRVDIALEHDSSRPRVGVLNVGTGVAIQGHHLVEIEAIIAGAMVREIGILDRAQPYGFGDPTLLRLVHRPFNSPAALRIAHDSQGFRYGLVQQRLQTDRGPATSLERPPIIPQYGPEVDMDQSGISEPQSLRDGEQLLKMLALPRIDHIKNLVRTKLLLAVKQRRQIGGRVQISTILLADDHRRIESRQEDTDSPLAITRQARLPQPLDNTTEHLVIETLSQRIVEGNTEAFINPVDLIATIG